MAKSTASLAVLKNEVESLKSTASEAMSELSALEKKRADLADAPTNTSDIKAALDAWVDAEAESYRAKLKPLLETLTAIPNAIDVALKPEGGHDHLTKLLSQARFSLPAEATAVGAMILAVGPDAAKAALHRELDLAITETGGKPLAARRAEVAKLDADIQSHREALDELRASAARIGVSLN